VRVGSWKRQNAASTSAPPVPALTTRSKAAKAKSKRPVRKATAPSDEAAATSSSTAAANLSAVAKPAIKKSRRKKVHIDILPDDILDGPVLDALGFKDLCALSLVCRRFDLAVNQGSKRWRTLYRERWGEPCAITAEASKLAGGWSKFYKAKHVAEKESAPWIQPCEYELQAILNHLASFSLGSFTEEAAAVAPAPAAPATMAPAASATSPGQRTMISRSVPRIMVTFLVDGSGSVTEEDFSTMTTFMSKAVATVNAHTEGRAKFGVIQFSNEVKVELGLGQITSQAFDAFANGMSRMNGGTNIALALSKACSTIASSSSSSGSSAAGDGASASAAAGGPATCVAGVELPHLVLLLTDGRVDSYQAREAVDRAEQFASQVPGVTFFAFAVGRSVDKQELTKIVRKTCKLDPKAFETREDFNEAKDRLAETRVMGLRTLDEPPW